VKKLSPQERTQEDWSLRLLGNLRADVIVPYIPMTYISFKGGYFES
jgi:hypothetical protein